MKILKFVVVLAVIAAIGIGAKQFMANAEVSKLATAEMKLEEAEMAQCKERLKMFHAAWNEYKKKNKGSEPPTIESLVPKYVKTADLLACPTYARWNANGKPLASGSITLDGKSQPVSYGFQWLSSSSGILIKKLKDKAPLLLCETHREAVYRAAYKRPLDMKSFDENEVGKLVAEVKNTPILTVRRDGTVGNFDRAEIAPPDEAKK